MKSPDKYDQLLKWFGRLQHAAIAFSGGVDSTFVLATAHQVLGEQAMALSVKTPYIPQWEIDEAIAFCRQQGIRHRVIQTGILPEILNNPENRCYLCKKHLFSMLKHEVGQEGMHVILDGSNADDSGVYRPGLAALKELGIRSPLLENGITKEDVRHFSRKLGLSTAEKPSYACLLTRLPYHYEIKTVELTRIEKAEQFLASRGYAASRVRNHGSIARIELLKNSIAAFVNSPVADEVAAYFRDLGYDYVTVDLEGYRTGSFDHNLKKTTL
jgi:pyridinium-3,5-biscarboxylic acid mononucleotide sulfurtransferase